MEQRDKLASTPPRPRRRCRDKDGSEEKGQGGDDSIEEVDNREEETTGK